jgi:hypothetical protein
MFENIAMVDRLHHAHKATLTAVAIKNCFLQGHSKIVQC